MAEEADGVELCNKDSELSIDIDNNKNLIDVVESLTEYECLENDSLEDKCSCLSEINFTPSESDTLNLFRRTQLELSYKEIANDVFELHKKWINYKGVFALNGSELPSCSLKGLSKSDKYQIGRQLRSKDFSHVKDFFKKHPNRKLYSSIHERILGNRDKVEDYMPKVKREVLINTLIQVVNKMKKFDVKTKELTFTPLDESEVIKIIQNVSDDYPLLRDKKKKFIYNTLLDATKLASVVAQGEYSFQNDPFTTKKGVEDLVETTLEIFLKGLEDDYAKDCYLIDRKWDVLRTEYAEIEELSRDIPADVLFKSLEKSGYGATSTHYLCKALDKSFLEEEIDADKKLETLVNFRNKVSFVKKGNEYSIEIEDKILGYGKWLRSNGKGEDVTFHVLQIQSGFHLNEKEREKYIESTLDLSDPREVTAVNEFFKRSSLEISSITLPQKIMRPPRSNPKKSNFFSRVSDRIHRNVNDIITNSHNSGLFNSKGPVTSKVIYSNSNAKVPDDSHAIKKPLNMNNSVSANIKDINVKNDTKKKINITEKVNNGEEIDKLKSGSEVETKTEIKVVEDKKEVKDKKTKGRDGIFSYFSSPVSYKTSRPSISFPTFSKTVKTKKRDIVKHKQSSLSKVNKRVVKKKTSDISNVHNNKKTKKKIKKSFENVSFEQFVRDPSNFKIPNIKIASHSQKHDKSLKNNDIKKTSQLKTISTNKIDDIDRGFIPAATVSKAKEEKNKLYTGKMAKGDYTSSTRSNYKSSMLKLPANNIIQSNVPFVARNKEASRVTTNHFLLNNQFKVAKINDLEKYLTKDKYVYVIASEEINFVEMYFLDTYLISSKDGVVNRKRIKRESVLRVRGEGKKLDVMNEFFSLKRKGILQ
jgi:hypothetical protein